MSIGDGWRWLRRELATFGHWLNVAMVCVAALSVPMPVQAGSRVAVMGLDFFSASSNDDVRGKLLATGQFDAVDIFDLRTVTPTLAQMQQYCGVLVYTGDSFSNAVTFGNNLADYVDSGGGVVTALFAVATLPIEGRFDSD